MTDLSGAAADPDAYVLRLDRVADADLWLWLAGLFADAPTGQAIEVWRRGPLAALAADPDLAAGVGRMTAALADGDADPVRRLGIGFGRLFLGIGGPDTVAPYESAHTGDGRLFQAPVGDMERLLAAHDLSVAADVHEPADHLAIELALMARLVATDHPDRALLAERLAAWVPTFCRLCIERDPTGFFAGAAEVLAAVLDREISGPSASDDEETKNQRREK